MPLTSLLIIVFVVAAVCALAALGHAVRARHHWRSRRRLAATHRALWATICLLLALLLATGGTGLLGYRRLTAEQPIARIAAQAIGPQRFAVAVTTPDGDERRLELAGDDWQLDARVIKWDPRAVVLGAPVLYRLDRISGRYHDIAQETEAPRSVVGLSSPGRLDLWQLKRQFPRWLPWIDADYGSAAYLPLVDGGRYTVTLAATGGLIARPADAATAAKIPATW